MQVNTSKNILLIILLIIIPVALSAQIGTRKYITRSGDTTVIVNAGSTGLSGDDAQFLLDARNSAEGFDRYSRYNKLKEAAEETDQVAQIVDIEKKETNPSSGSLGFRIAQKNIRYLQNEQKATRAARDIIHRDASIEELTYLKEKFGEKPSYFVNGIQVDSKTAATVSEKDILTRSLKVSNTATGNPNGEIWYVVNSKIFDKLGLENYELQETNSYASNQGKNPVLNQSQIEESIFDEEIATMPSSITSQEYKQLAPEQQQMLTAQQREVEELKKQIEEVRKQRAAISGSVYQAPRSSQSSSSTATRASTTPRRTQQQTQEVVGFRDSPQERTRRERDEMDQMSDSNITTETPKRSVRRIKDRERNR